ncbi:p53 and DNA damage-regulated protein 1 [Mortierella alpina]|nr:p53 and DNA damage-regulated protein 1 [Mortierella alpina]
MELVSNLQKRELIAEEILTNKDLIVDYDRRRNKKKVWVNLGDMFIKMPKENVETMIKKDQVTLDTEISEIRQVMKEKVVELEKLEGGDGSKSRAFQLKAMTK